MKCPWQLSCTRYLKDGPNTMGVYTLSKNTLFLIFENMLSNYEVQQETTSFELQEMPKSFLYFRNLTLVEYSNPRNIFFYFIPSKISISIVTWLSRLIMIILKIHMISVICVISPFKGDKSVPFFKQIV